MNPNGNNTYKDETELKRCQEWFWKFEFFQNEQQYIITRIVTAEIVFCSVFLGSYSRLFWG